MHVSLRGLRSSLLISLSLGAAILAASSGAGGQGAKVTYTPAEKAVIDQLKGLRAVPDDQRGHKTIDLALQIRALPAAGNKVRLAVGLASMSTEGDFGHDSLQAVATTLSTALSETPVPEKDGKPSRPYLELASLVRYEHVTADLKDPQFAQAGEMLITQEAEVEKADFTLSDLSGKSWTLHSLRGKVVLVNFWATWCPPCRKEMPDLQLLSRQFSAQGLVVLSISDEDVGKVTPYIAEHQITYPVLLDPERRANEAFQVEGIPKNFVFNRDGKLVAQSIDMRTRGQFLTMLASAGLHD